jgi:negative regulator of flagellin synthesis FlgM
MPVDTVITGSRRSDVSSKISSVDTRTGPVGAGRAVERVRDATRGAGTDSGNSAAGDVHITGTAAHLADLEQTIKDMPAVDEAKVAAISSALAEGRYQIVPERIADGLMQLEQALAPLGEK